MKFPDLMRHGACGGAAAACLLAAGPVAATNGYFSHGYSAAQSALGGAGTALVEDTLVASINPAGVAWTGNRYDVGLSAFSPVRDYTAGPRGDDGAVGIFTIGPGLVGSDNELFFIPGFGITWAIDEVSSVGIAVYGNGGMNSEYHGNSARFGQNFGLGVLSFEAECAGSFGSGQPSGADAIGFCGSDDPTASVNLMQLFIMPTYARKLGERTSVGISPIIAGQRFRADGLSAFAPFSNQPDKVSGNGYELSFGYGARVGFLTGALPGLGFGTSYQTRIRMTEFDKYAGLFAEAGGFDIPSTWNVGISAHPGDNLRIALDYQRINFSEIRSIGNPLDSNRFVNACAVPRLLNGLVPLLGSNAPNDACLGADGGPGFGWRDVQVYKAGVQYRFAAFKFRAGYSRNDAQPIPQDEVLLNILAPAVIREHYTAGVGFQYSPKLGFDFAAMYAPNNPVRGKNPLSNAEADVLQILAGGPAAQTAFDTDANDQDITLDMYQWQITLGVSYRFD